MAGSYQEMRGNGSAEFMQAYGRIMLGKQIGEVLAATPSLRVTGSFVITQRPYVSYERVDVFPPYGAAQILDPRRRITREPSLLTIFRKGISAIDTPLLLDARAMKAVKNVDGRDIKPIDGRHALTHFEVAGWMAGQPEALADVQALLKEGKIPQYQSTEAFEQAAHELAWRNRYC